MDISYSPEYSATNSEEGFDLDDVTSPPSLPFQRPDSDVGGYENRPNTTGSRRPSSHEGLHAAGHIITDPATLYSDIAQYYGDVAEGELFLGDFGPGESRPPSARPHSALEGSSGTSYAGDETGDIEDGGQGSDRLSSESQSNTSLSASLASDSPPPEVDATLRQLIQEAVARHLEQDQQWQQQQQQHNRARTTSQLPQLYQRSRQAQAVAMDLQQGEPTVIDLTEEPDSPVLQQRAARLPAQQERPRRGIGAQPTVIDLTDDSPDAQPRHQGGASASSPEYIEVRPARPRRGQPNDILSELQLNFGFSQFARSHLPALPNFFPFHRQNQNPNPNIHIRNGRRMRGSSHDDYFLHGHQPVEVDFEILGQHYLPVNPLRGNQPELNYQMNGILQVPRMGGSIDQPLHASPPHIPPPPAREGFTRDTGEDVVAVCASCDEELMYDPDGGADNPPAKRARTRKDREEHHFWAVTACGHVYCRRCFENRRSKDPALGFASNGKATLCAVEGCQTDVTLKKAWVGLFL